MTFRDDLPRRRPINCPWSSSLYLLEVLSTIKISSHVFRGVLAEIVDESGCSLPPPALLWVLDTGTCLELWYDIHQRPQTGDSAHKRIKDVVAHHESAVGEICYAVVWEGFLCPGWVSDEDLASHTLVSDYWRRQMQRI